ncbi:hypothetical protein BCR33DRAFT_711581 [Rhizoclosmatium globosum]|uniref:RRM domain-containing protein n=1 Tax=Rhizoclosmatium globosum TaxID=329046 RepID=A0A1Y2D1U1_9FUNG|nr:hypothetical protein BCR33DRAFT_711581 [Rhizoclosmatium globosum]|eukprot:ORY53253.1 hypothetical protein BCR33DRAFT_711581 [Rhizoclosmatium globosum]
MEALSEQPYSFDAHAAYLSVLKQQGLKDELRAARQSMHSLFPFTEEMWTEWLNDELSAFAETLASVASDPSTSLLIQEQGMDLIALFDLAIQDYLCIPIYVKYATFLKDSVFPPIDDENDEGDSKSVQKGWLSADSARPLFNSLIHPTNLHFLESHKVWNVYISFELQVLATTPSASRAPQVDRIRSAYLTRLAVPHSTIDQTFQDYSPFETANDTTGTYEQNMRAASKIKSKTMIECSKRETSERRLQETGGSVHGYLEMADFWGKKDVHVARVVWERMVAVHFLVEQVWERYLVFLVTRMKVLPVLKGVVERAVRNCGWSGELWGHRLRIGESVLGEGREELDNVFANACGMILAAKNPNQFVKLARNRTGMIRRHLTRDSTNQEYKDLLRVTHQQSITLFRETFGPLFEDFRVELDSIHDEIHLFRDIQRARSVFDALVLANPASAKLLLLVSEFERNHGRDPARAKWVLTQGLGKQKGDEGRMELLNGLVELERVCGSGDDEDENGFYELLAKAGSTEWAIVGKRGREAKKQGWVYDFGVHLGVLAQQGGDSQQQQQQHQQHQVQYVEEQSGQKREFDEEDAPTSPERVTKKAKKDEVTELEQMEVDNPAAAPPRTENGEQAPVKKEFYTLDDSNAGNIIRLINVHPNTDPTFFKSLFETKLPPVDYYLKAQEDGTTDGFIEFTKAEDALNAALLGKIKVFKQYTVIQRCIPAKTKWGDLDETEILGTKIYVSNLDVGVNKPILRQVFGAFGKVKEIRLVLKTSNAFAYIKFEIARSAEKAVEGLDGKTLEGFPGRKIGVAISDKTKTKAKAKDPKELIVTNFTIATTKEDLHELFSKHGKVKDIRMLLDKSGVPRGVAFVEFEDEAGAKAALQVNGTELDGKIVSVAPSDPNVRGGAHLHGKKPFKPRDEAESVPTHQQHQRSKPGLGFSGPGGRGGGRGGRGGGNHAGETRSDVIPTSAAPSVSATTSSFVPRATARPKVVQVRPTAPVAASAAQPMQIDGGGSSGGQGKSQDDFRKMLLGKK